jgi:aspartate-semialdehyde dehydrogenase
LADLSNRAVVAVIGADTLKAKDVRDTLAARPRAPLIELVSANEQSTILTEEEGEAVIMRALTEESLKLSSVAMLAGSQASSRRAHKIASKPGSPVLVDLTGALEDLPNARLRAPMVEHEPEKLTREHVHVIAHPAAIALAIFFGRLDALGQIRRALVHVFEPASERGQSGMDELQQQTVALLSLQEMEREVYDTQAAFNMLPRYGEEAREPLEDVEARIDRNLATLLGPWPRIPMPSIRLVHAPVFHGYCFSVWVEFEDNPGADAAARALAGPDVEVRKTDEEPPSNTGVAGDKGITVGAITADRNNPRACWFWMAADNYMLLAENAAQVAEELL